MYWLFAALYCAWHAVVAKDNKRKHILQPIKMGMCMFVWVVQQQSIIPIKSAKVYVIVKERLQKCQKPKHERWGEQDVSCVIKTLVCNNYRLAE